MLRKRAMVALAAAAASGLPLMSLFNASPAYASSHREAPLISQDPTADGTDVYAFTPADDATSVTFVANFNPFQAGPGGPNFYRFGDDVQYQIHLDNDGQAADGITLTFNFKTNTNNPQTFLYNDGPMKVNGASATQYDHYIHFNRPQVYQLTVDQQPGTQAATTCQSPAVTDVKALFAPPVNVGPNSIDKSTSYHALAQAAVGTLACPNGNGNDTITVFAGQRSDPFFVDLGGAFDLLGLGAGQNVLTGLNVGSLVVNLPKTMLDRNRGSHELGSNARSGAGRPNATADTTQHIVGVWSSASRNAQTQVNTDGSRSAVNTTQIQVSRLGMPLVNEAVLSLKYKDVFNSRQPVNDGALPVEALNRVFKPELAGLFRALKLDPNAPTDNRQDLFATFIFGLDALGTHPSGGKPAEMIRYNYKVDPGTPAAAVNRLGPLGGDTNPGFPNGRRLLDDVVDIELLAVQGILCDPNHYSTFKAQFDAQPAALGLGQPVQGQCRNDPVVPGGNGLGDGVNKPDKPVQDVFPYLADPTQG